MTVYNLDAYEFITCWPVIILVGLLRGMSSVNLDRHSKLLVNRYGNRRICNWIVVTIFWIIGTFLVFKIVLSYLLILLTMIKILKNYIHPINHPQQRHHWIRRLSFVLHPLTSYPLSLSSFLYPGTKALSQDSSVDVVRQSQKMSWIPWWRSCSRWLWTRIRTAAVSG